MLRKIIAAIVTMITLWLIKETIFIFTTPQADIAKNRDFLKLASLSIVIPLLIVNFWLWRPKPKVEDDETR
ncbi:MAG: hypothetical protein REI64_17815 [Pedobacter sp.]|uniref:hypothetical protein n=1 Tax=Pedobacter sp. TaxID=1411316 RepID=UPI002808E488|nr:hypothetical protein [Pedobacter sp.]MDQ8006666.1 hypothetical protein [Pedobacter sp.]